MNVVTPAEWSAALRSGDRVQTQCRARGDSADGGFCYCGLGVLADLVDPDGWSERESVHGTGYVWRQVGGSFTGGWPVWLTRAIRIEAIRKNDMLEFTFNDLANWIDDGMKTR